ncbi:DUF4105 domain-containing protein [Flavihumibacter solisilvae]|uniref:Uncharacterized protein n=1 Tax=Flavihumibacter solisilvae TaxID=1349421 RepID=A0A0C1IMJ9_9BACT|nr:DUF4105 domain-containing protein [Flavihumibacter solisilvae]KIC95460.1 hypothetical protein OI18_06135 [Flavihumibacter solisilvae]
MAGIFRIALFLVLGFCSAAAFGRTGGQYRISILTCGVGDDLYAVFGHTAIRVTDSVNKKDVVYNFGTFDFESRNFVTEFLSGKLLYFLSLEDFNSFIATYQEENRDVIEQELMLTPEEEDVIVRKLELANTDRSRYYRYEFFKNNCTTKVLDLIWDYLGSSGKQDSLSNELTTRKLLHAHLISNDRKWLDLGINLILGSEIDKPLSRRSSLFLPALLQSELGKQSSVVKETVLFKRDAQSTFPLTPGSLFSGLLFVSLVLTFIPFEKWQKVQRVISVSLMLTAGIIGVVIVWFWLGIGRDIYKWNYNLVWAFPSNFLLAYAVLRNRGEFKWLFKAHLVAGLLFLIATPWLPQAISLPVILLMILLLVTYYQAHGKAIPSRPGTPPHLDSFS